MMPFNPPGSSDMISPAMMRRVRNMSADASFGMVPTPARANYFSFFGANENGRFTAETEVGELGYGGCESGGHAGVYSGASFMEDAHASFSRPVAACRYGSFGASDGLTEGLFAFGFALGKQQRDGAKEKKYGLAPHARIIGDSPLGGCPVVFSVVFSDVR
jgi:hypothetical protein